MANNRGCQALGSLGELTLLDLRAFNVDIVRAMRRFQRKPPDQKHTISCWICSIILSTATIELLLSKRGHVSRTSPHPAVYCPCRAYHGMIEGPIRQ